MEWAIFGITTFVVLVGLGIYADNLRRKRNLALQEMFQRERLLAIEKGLPIPDWAPALAAAVSPPQSSEQYFARRIQMFRFMSLCLGIVLAFAGVGMMLAFGLSDDSGFNSMHSLGAIPLFVGVGLLLFYVLTRNAAEKDPG